MGARRSGTRDEVVTMLHAAPRGGGGGGGGGGQLVVMRVAFMCA